MVSKNVNEVVVIDVRMSFASMVVVMVKWANATIPAIIIITAVGSITFSILNVIFGGFHHRMV